MSEGATVEEPPGPVGKQLSAADGFPVMTRRFPAAHPQAVIVVAGATGVPQGFYRRFAEYAAARGFDVITFDYRGIGESAPDSLRGFRMDYRDWGRLDLASVLAHARSHLPIHLVSHSFGGQALGLLPDPTVVASMHAFGTGSGWHGWMPRAERLRVAFLWDCRQPAGRRRSAHRDASAAGHPRAAREHAQGPSWRSRAYRRRRVG
ncbi:MAG: alpha/beta fold hydrolase, partial [Actinomycetales bacterium]|nr:alpha/beta fold hydrolase [Actinomycetales bacterium]